MGGINVAMQESMTICAAGGHKGMMIRFSSIKNLSKEIIL
jgi:hypothetical protein